MADTRNVHIPLGSGLIYYKEFSGSIPDDETIETEANQLGKIEGGAQIEYKSTFKTFKDDLGTISRTELTEEEATLKASLIAWSMADMEVYAATARVDTKTKTGHRIIKIGGLSNNTGKSYIFRFVHKDSKYGDVRVSIVGKQSDGFTLDYKVDDAGKMELNVQAESMDNEGTLVLYDETLTTTATSSGS